MEAIRFPARRATQPTAAAVAGAAYVAVWLVGLAIWPASPGPDDTSRQVVVAFGGHPALGAAQFLLVEAFAAIPLPYVIVALARSAARTGARGRGRLLATTGLGACAISVSQGILGVVLATSLARDAHLGAAGAVFDVINRLDGAKMLLLAATIATALLARQPLGTPRWLAAVGALATTALVASGVGYAGHAGALSGFAALSLPLLLAWVAGSGAVAARPQMGRHRAASPTTYRRPAS